VSGVIASAGAQLDLTVMTVKSRTSGKDTLYGFHAATSTGSLTNATLEAGNGTTYTCSIFEDTGSAIQFVITGAADSDTTFKRLTMLGANGTALNLARSDRASYSNGTFNFSTSSAVLSGNNNGTVTIELRSD